MIHLGREQRSGPGHPEATSGISSVFTLSRCWLLPWPSDRRHCESTGRGAAVARCDRPTAGWLHGQDCQPRHQRQMPLSGSVQPSPLRFPRLRKPSLRPSSTHPPSSRTATRQTCLLTPHSGTRRHPACALRRSASTCQAWQAVCKRGVARPVIMPVMPHAGQGRHPRRPVIAHRSSRSRECHGSGRT